MRLFGGCAARRAVVTAALLLVAPARAADLGIGIAGPIGTLDPHLPATISNVSVLAHIFQPLVDLDVAQRPIPALAVSWKSVDPLTWEFELRKGVKWHDGSEFTAQDVQFSIDRMPAFATALGVYTRPISGTEIVGPHLIRLRTAEPAPLLPTDLANVMILSRKHGEAASPGAFESGRATIGTGPYRFVEAKPGEGVFLEKHAAYWGGPPTWDKVEIRYIAEDSARVAALLAGDVQLIDRVPVAELGALKQNREIKLASAASDRLIHLQLDTGREGRSPFVIDRAGNRMEKNPLRDPRVRAAISRAINREAIVGRLMEGQGVPAGQFLPENFFGASKKLGAAKHDPDGAKKLLGDAGYPEGFGITLHTADRNEQIAAAIAEMLTRIGIETRVEAMPTGAFLSRGAKGEFSLQLAGWGAGSGGVAASILALAATFDPKKGSGIANRGRYSNPALDSVLNQALEAIDDAAREKLLVEASEIAMQDNALIPILFNMNMWAMRGGLNYEARADGRSTAMGAKPPRG